MKHSICECGHEHEGRACILCDCPRFVLKKRTTDRGPRVSAMIRRMVRKMDMNR